MSQYRLDQYQADKFKKIFKIPYTKVWDNLTGIDMQKLDKFLKTPPGRSMQDIVEEQYGQDAAVFLESLFNIVPIADFTMNKLHKEIKRNVAHFPSDENY